MKKKKSLHIKFNQADQRKTFECYKRSSFQLEYGDYISSYLEEEVSHWRPGDVVFISASPGSGKNYFVHECLYEYCKDSDEYDEVCLLVNRKVLYRQQVNDAKNHELIRGRRKVGMNIFTYQQMCDDLSISSKVMEKVTASRYIVCDECHFFLSDAEFNPGIQKILEQILMLYPQKILIFMSGTIEEVKPLIEDALNSMYTQLIPEREFQFADECSDNTCQTAWLEDDDGFSGELDENESYYPPTPRVHEYVFKSDMSEKILDIKYFEDILEIADEVVLAKGEKWLIFVKSKKDANRLLDAIEAKNPKIRVVLVDADTNGKAHVKKDNLDGQEELQKIENNEKFECDVLISTTVLDNGISLKDESLCHIVLHTQDRVEFLQMLNRKRQLSKTDKAILYVWKGSQSEFKKYMERNNKIYWWLCEHLSMSMEKWIQTIRKDWSKVDILCSNYYIESSRKEMGLSELSLERHRMLKLTLERYVSEMEKDSDYFLKEQCRWLGIEMSDNFVLQKIGVSQDEILRVKKELEKIFLSGGIIEEPQNLFEQIKSIAVSLMNNDQRKKESKRLKIDAARFNKYFSLCDEWKDFRVITCKPDRLPIWYELEKNGQKAFKLLDTVNNPEMIKGIVKNNDMYQAFEKLTGKECPSVLRGEKGSTKISKYLNDRLELTSGSTFRGDKSKQDYLTLT